MRAACPRRWWIVRTVTLVSVGVLPGCASARIRKANARALAAADARVLEGCYDCLLEARATYVRLSGGKPDKETPGRIVRLFETDLLLALREKELALDWRASMDRARSLVPRVPPSLEPRRLLEIADAVLPDGDGIPPKTLGSMRKLHEPFVQKIPSELTWLARAPLRPAVREYVAFALDCSYPVRPDLRNVSRDSLNKRHQPPPNAPPLVRYRAGICGETDSTALRRVAAVVPAFVETAYFLARPAVFAAPETGGDDAQALLERAYGRFPTSPSVTFVFGWLGTMIGECSNAVRRYDETIATQPAHEYAYLQRTICLTNLRLDSAAIESATRLIALDTRSTSQAYYWRALNRLRRRELELARSDIETAKAMATEANTLTLAGIIEHDQDDLPVAERDLRAAFALIVNGSNCTAAWYLGLVLNKGKRWGESAASFEAAMGCYDLKVAVIHSRIAKLQGQANRNPAYTAKRITRLEADSTAERTRYFASAFNGAGNFANAGNVARANELLDIAVQDPKLAEQVAKLREQLRGVAGR